VVEKRIGFSVVVMLGSRCVVWLLSMVEETLHKPGSEEFVNSFKEGSKATFV
jgi:hypothetical protein